MFLILFAVMGIILGTILGHLFVQYKINEGVNPMTMKIKEVNQYEILKALEEED